MRYIIIPGLFLALLGGCSSSDFRPFARLPSPRDLPIIHKIDVQQGNVITQEMVARLRPQMDKKKVQFIMGTPIIKDTFNADRWDYLYTYEHGGGTTERRHVTLHFEEDKLASITGDVTPASEPLVVDLHQDRSVKVPGFKKRSLINRITSKIPFVDEPAPVIIDDDPAVQTDEEALAAAAKEEAEAAALFAIEQVEPANPYADIQAGPGEGVVEIPEAGSGEGIIVPPDAPRVRKKKGIVTRFFDSIGIGADEDAGDEEEGDFDPGDPKYRDITNQNDV